MKTAEVTTVSSSQKKGNKRQRTYRFDVNLGESNSDTCPEYSYVDFVKNEMRANGNPFEDHDEDNEVAAIAQRFEAKYGPKGLHSGKKSRTQEIDDYYDPGGGYDEDDPFIDNTEAYDEVIPSSLMTQHGGFYINQGQLDFKSLNDDSLDMSKQVSKKKKMKALEFENEEEIGENLARKFKSMKRKNFLESRDNNSSKTTGGITVKKKKRLKLNPPVSDSLSQKNVMDSSLLLSSFPTTATDIVMTTTQTKSTAVITTNGNADVGNGGAEKNEYSAIEETFNAVLREAINEDSTSKSGEEGRGDNQSAERNTQLPSQLPPEIIEAIENMKREAKETKEKKFFSAYINKLLLDIELGSHKLPWGSKTAIYNHLSEHLPYGKYTLQRRAKKLREIQEEDQLKGPILNLKTAIGKVMPALEEQHGLDIQKTKMGAESREDLIDVVREEMSTDSEGEEKSDTRKKPKGARRRFQWNTEIRDLLQHIVSTKMKHYSSGKIRSQNAEELLKAYLDSDIKPLWPQGWMQTRMLFKESKKMHEDLTKGLLQQGKLKKSYADVEAHNMGTEGTQNHAPKNDDVIEVSSIVEDVLNNKDTVVINLPNSVASMSQVFQTSVPSQTTLGLSPLSTETVKISVTMSTVTQVPSLTVTPSVSQKAAEISGSLSVKDVATVSVSDPLKIQPTHRKDVGVKSLNQGASGSSMAQTSSFSNSYRSFLEAMDDINNNGSAKSKPLSASSQQQIRTSIPQQRSYPQKVSVLQQKSDHQQQMVRTKHDKASEEVQIVADSQQHKAAVRSSPNEGVNKDIHNSSWKNLGTLVPAKKSINPAVTVDRILDQTSQKPAPDFKTSNAILQQNQLRMSQGPHQQNMLNTSAKSNHNIVQKNLHLGNGSSPPGIVSTISGNQFAIKTGVTTVNAVASSKQGPQNQTLAEFQDSKKNSTLPNLQLKSETVFTNSLQKFSPKQNQIIKTGTIIGTSAALSLSARSAADFTGWTSNKTGIIKQPLPLGKLVTSAVSITKSSTATSSQPSKPLSSINIKSAASQTSSQSALSPVELAALSAYEKIKTQLQYQEEIEGQALKNLAMAFKLEGSSHSGLHDKDGDTKISQKAKDS